MKGVSIRSYSGPHTVFRPNAGKGGSEYLLRTDFTQWRLQKQRFPDVP